MKRPTTVPNTPAAKAEKIDAPPRRRLAATLALATLVWMLSCLPAEAQTSRIRRFFQSSLSRPIEQEGENESKGSALRWRFTKLPTPFSRRNHDVRQASGEAPVNQANPLTPPVLSGIEPTSDLSPPVMSNPNDVTPTPAPAAPTPMAAAPRQASSEPRHYLRMAQRDGAAEGEEPCERIYNNRNCCEQSEDCERARRYFQENPITSISLNITPEFRPETPTQGEGLDPLQVDRAAQLAKAAPRKFRNRAGQVLTEGRFVDYVNGRIYVQQPSGQVVKIPAYNLSDDDLCFVHAWWELPGECLLEDEPYEIRNWVCSTFTWKASALCHKPLYFEELALERYGHTTGHFSQPFVSGAHFFLNIAVLPYKMGMNPPGECQYALGYYRPGSCAPWLIPPIPISLRGAVAQAAVVGTLIPVLP